MLYAVKCYWPGVTPFEVERVSVRAASRPHLDDVTYLGSLLFAKDELVLCMFDGPSRTAVASASEQAGIPCERVMEAVWLQPANQTPIWRSALAAKRSRGRRR